MVNSSLISPKRIAVFGASNSLAKPGGKLIENLLISKFTGQIYPVNPKEKTIQGLHCYQQPNDLPNVDMAILAIRAEDCPAVVQALAEHKQTRAFIIVSAGFSEVGAKGVELEEELKHLASQYKISILGPNCIGLLTQELCAVFTSPLPRLHPQGCDFVSASGAFAVFVFEVAARHGLAFSSVFSVGNSVQNGVEEILEFWDEEYIEGQSSRIKLIYAEQIRNPGKFLKHAMSLYVKGCRLVAIVPGSSEAGNRAALSHTGALAGSGLGVSSLLRKAGIIQCFSRSDFVHLALVLSNRELNGKNLVVITHAGGPGVLLADALSKAGFCLPELKDEQKKYIDDLLFTGASSANPVDMMATGNRDQLTQLIEYFDNSVEEIDGIAVIYGSTGMEDLSLTYRQLNDTIKACNKPIYVVMPSITTAHNAADSFVEAGNPLFFDEVSLAQALGQMNQKYPVFPSEKLEIVSDLVNSFDSPDQTEIVTDERIEELFREASIPLVGSVRVHSIKDLEQLLNTLTFPLVAKAIGILHKTDVDAVSLNIISEEQLRNECKRILKIDGAKSVLIQPQLSGTEIFVGVKREDNLGHIMMCGLGGIFIEVLKEFNTAFLPITEEEALHMLKSLSSYPILEGMRGKPGIPIMQLANIMVRVSDLIMKYPEIVEMDLNPLIADATSIQVVDARIIQTKKK